MTIPEIRKALHELADQLGGHEGALLHYYAEETRRRPPLRVAPSRCERRVTRTEIERFFRRYPRANNMDAASHFGVNTRAISYAYAGRRT